MIVNEFGITILAPLPRNRVRCPYCRDRIAGLLAVCPKPDCRVADAADTATYEAGCD